MLQQLGTDLTQDTEILRGLPIMVASPTSRRPSPGSDHPKRLPQHCSPCTTQASPPATTDYRTGSHSGHGSPTTPTSTQQAVETSVPGDIPYSSQNRGRELDETHCAGSASPSQEVAQGGQSPQHRYMPKELQHRVESMWLNQQTDYVEYDDYSDLQKSHPHPAGDGCSSQPLNTLHHIIGYDNSTYTNPMSTQSHYPFPQSSLGTFDQVSGQQPPYYENRFGIATHAQSAHSVDNSAQYDTEMGGHLKQEFETSEPNYITFVPAADPFQSCQTSTGGLPTTTLSPCSSSLAVSWEAPRAREDTVTPSDAGMDLDSNDLGFKDDIYSPESMMGSPSSVEPSGGKTDEPYAQLIYQAFMSRPNKSMSLQEIYQWFRLNTDKAKSEGKGWQNSIRHNLSMNGAFTKRNSKAAVLNKDGSLSLDASLGLDGRKSTEWFLEPEHYGGVESTTRYRKGNGSIRSRGTGHSLRGSRVGGGGSGAGTGAGAGAGGPAAAARGVAATATDSQPTNSSGGGGPTSSHARVSAGRKGGYQAAHARKRVKGEQQPARRLQHHQPQQHPYHYHHDQRNLRQHFNPSAPAISTQYHDNNNNGGGDDYFRGYAPISSPFPTATGAGAGAFPPSSRHLAINDLFPPGDLGVTGNNNTTTTGFNNNNNKRSRTDDNNHTATSINDNSSEPTTPPGCALEPQEDLAGGFGGKNHPSPPFLSGYELGAYVPGAGGHHLHYQQFPGAGGGGYTLAAVTGEYEAPIGGHQPPLFVDQEAFLGSGGDAVLRILGEHN